MTLNATLLGQFILLLVIIVGVVAWRLAAGGWRLARRKSQHPVLITFLCVLLCLFPPLALLALLVLALWRDLPARA